MEKKAGKNIRPRWTVPFAGFLLTLMAGMAYAWGVFVVPIVDRFGWTTAEATLPFTIFMAIIGICVIPAGRLQDTMGPRRIAAIGAVLFIVAYGLAALVGHFPYPWWLLITYSLIGGTGAGLVYSCAAPPARKWFPDRPGFAISCAVAGFGLAAVLFAPLKANHLIPTYGIEGSLLIMGIACVLVCLVGAWLISNPPDGWVPPRSGPSKGAANQVKAISDIGPREALRSPIFWLLYVGFFLVLFGAMMTVGLIAAFGELVVELTAGQAGVAVAIFAGFNGFGRPAAGWLCDRFGALWVMMVSFAVQGLALATFHVFATTLPTLYIAAALMGWGLAVSVAAYPIVTAACFGTKHLGVNYGMVLSSLAPAALAPALGAAIYDSTGSFTPAFVAAGIGAFITVLLTAVLKWKYSLV